MKLRTLLYIIILFLCFTHFLSCTNADDVINGDTQKRVVSLSPSATEILFAIDSGHTVVARTDFCNYPEEALQIPSLGGFDGKSFSLESIMAKKPDFVYATKGMHDHLIKPLESYGITVFLSHATSLTDIYEEITMVANLMGKEERAALVVAQMKENIAIIHKAVEEKSSRSVYWEVWSSPYMSVGSTSYINDLIHQAGGKNIFLDVHQDYPVVSEESILRRNPQVILLPGDTTITKENVLNRIGWENIEAVKNGDIFFITPDIVSRPGPRADIAVHLIATTLFPDDFF